MSKKIDPKVAARIEGLRCSARSAPPPTSVGADKRAAVRRNCYKIAHIVFGGYDVACIVRDIGVGGARIEIQGDASFPSQVTLRLSETRATQLARVVWQKGRQAGLAF